MNQIKIDMGDTVAISNYIRMNCGDKILCLNMNQLIDKHMLSSFVIAEAWCRKLQMRTSK